MFDKSADWFKPFNIQSSVLPKTEGDDNKAVGNLRDEGTSNGSPEIIEIVENNVQDRVHSQICEKRDMESSAPLQLLLPHPQTQHFHVMAKYTSPSEDETELKGLLALGGASI